MILLFVDLIVGVSLVLLRVGFGWVILILLRSLRVFVWEVYVVCFFFCLIWCCGIVSVWVCFLILSRCLRFLSLKCNGFLGIFVCLCLLESVLWCVLIWRCIVGSSVLRLSFFILNWRCCVCRLNELFIRCLSVMWMMLCLSLIKLS